MKTRILVLSIFMAVGSAVAANAAHDRNLDHTKVAGKKTDRTNVDLNAADSVEELTAILDIENDQEKLDAIKKLGELAQKAAPAVPKLVKLFADKNEKRDVRIGAAETLRKIGRWSPDDVVPALNNTLKDKDAQIRAHAVAVLASLGRPAKEAVPALLKQLENRGPLRVDIIRALDRISPRSRDVAAKLEVILLELDSAAKIAAVRSLRRTKAASDSCIRAMIQVLSDENVKLRRAAAWELKQYGADARDAVPELIKTLKDKDAEVRRGTIAALAAIGGNAREAAPALIAELENRDAMRTEIIKALGAIGSQSEETVKALEKILTEVDAESRIAAAETLRRLRAAPENSIKALIEVLGDRRANRAEAAQELARHGADAKEAIPALIKLLKEGGYSTTRAAAAYALGEMGPAAMDAVPDLVGALKDETQRGRKAAAQALIKIYEK